MDTSNLLASSPIEGKSVIISPYRNIIQTLEGRNQSMNTRPAFTQAEVLDIIKNAGSDSHRAQRTVALRVWEAFGRKGLTEEMQIRQFNLAGGFIAKAKSGEKFSHPTSGERSPLEFPETEVLLFGMDPYKWTHVALPRNSIALMNHADSDLFNVHGTPEISLAVSENKGFDLMVSMVRNVNGKKQRLETPINVNDIVTRDGSGLPGLIPHIDPDFRREKLNWDDSFKSERDLMETMMPLIANKGIRTIPLRIDQFATKNNVVTFKEPHREVLGLNQFRKGGIHLIGSLHTHPADDDVNFPDYLPTPEDVLTALTIHKQIDTFGIEDSPQVLFPAFGIGVFDKTGKMQKINYFKRVGLTHEDVVDFIALAERASVQREFAKQEQGGSLEGQDELKRFLEKVDERMSDTLDFIDTSSASSPDM